jgi:hypothetical protein
MRYAFKPATVSGALKNREKQGSECNFKKVL